VEQKIVNMKSGLAFNRLAAVLWILLVFKVCRMQTQSVFQSCDNSYNINPGSTYLESPYYPNYYPSGTACRYIFTAPSGYAIEATCTIETDRAADKCTTENIYVSIDGDPQLRGSENFCGSGSFTRKSLFNKIVLAYISQGSYGRFKCTLNVVAQPCDCGWSVTSKIVNGQQANINEFPYMVALHEKASNIRAFCGATIISKRFLLTAAHCAVINSNPANLEALVGDHDLTSSTETLYAARYDISQIIVHPNYQSQPEVKNDIALFRTAVDIQFSRGVGPICLPLQNAASNFDYKYVNLAGWGTTSFGGVTSTVLRKAQVYTTTNSFCQSNYGSETVIDPSEICTASNEYKDACQYDSGGPLILQASRAFQLGIISFGRPCGTGSPTVGINTRLTSYLSWISGYVGSGGLCSKAI